MSVKKKQNRIQVCLQSTESKFRMYTHRKRVVGLKLELKKYDPIVRKHVPFKEVK